MNFYERIHNLIGNTNIPFLLENLKACLKSFPTLRLPDYTKKFILQTDASLLGLGAVLQQEFEDGLHPIAYISRSLKDGERNYPIYELELKAIHYALNKFRPYLEGSKTIVQTDHASLKYLMQQKNLSRKVVRWVKYLQRFNIKIAYKKGKDNIVADGLSRNTACSEVNSATIINEDEFYAHMFMYFSDSQTTKNLPEAWQERIEKESVNFSFREGTLFKNIDGKWIRFLPLVLRADTIIKAHKSLGHISTEGILDYCRTRLWFPKMKSFIQDLIAQCCECQKVNNSSKIPSEVLHPFPPTGPFKRWNIDFVGPLPETKTGNQYILVAIDSFTKWPVARAMPQETAQNVAKFLYEEFLMNYACPAEIVSDRGSKFLAEIMEHYLQSQNIKHLKSSAYHPTTNGQVDNLNKFIKNMLTKYVMDFPTR